VEEVTGQEEGEGEAQYGGGKVQVKDSVQEETGQDRDE